MGAYALPAPEEISGDSLTRWIRGLANFLAGQGAGALETGMGTTAKGVDTAGKALTTLDPALEYWNKILSGDRAATTAAVSPFAGQVSRNLAGAQTTVQQQMPRGGYAASLNASLPFAAATQVNEKLLSLQPEAAKAIESLGGTQGGIAQILGQLGLGTANLGGNLLSTGYQGQLQRRGQNVQESANSPLNTFLSGLAGIPGSMAGALAGGVTGKLGGALKLPGFGGN